MSSQPRISVVTAVYNRVATIGDAIESIASQDYTEKEHIVVDGLSTDGTSDVIEQRRESISQYIREGDSGIYDALNKGIRAATGDVVGFLHADDVMYATNALRKIADCFSNPNVDAVYGDLVYVDTDNTDKIIRYWKSGTYRRERFRWGWMPPHPTVYIRKSVYERLGSYRTDLGTAADYECLVRLFYKGSIRPAYCPETLVKMRQGGASNASAKSRILANRSDRQAWLVNGLTPPFCLRVLKPLQKLPQYFLRP